MLKYSAHTVMDLIEIGRRRGKWNWFFASPVTNEKYEFDRWKKKEMKKKLLHTQQFN